MDRAKFFLKKLGLIFSLLSDYKKELVLLSVLGVFSAIGNAATPFFGGRVIDLIISPSETDLFSWTIPSVAFFLGIWFCVSILVSIFDWQIGLRNEKLQLRASNEYMVKGFSHVLNLPLSFHAERKPGEVVNRFNEARYSMVTIGQNLVQLSPQILSLFVALIISLFIDVWLTGILLLGVIIYVIFLSRVVRPAAKFDRKMHKAYSRAFGDLYDAAGNVRAVKQAGAEEFETKKSYNNFVTNAAGAWFKLLKLWSSLNVIQRIVVVITQFSIFVVSVIFISNGRLTVGELVMFNGYAAMFFGPFVQLGTSWQRIQNGVTALGRSEAILKLKKENFARKNSKFPENITGDIEFKNVSFAYKDGGKILNNLSLHVSKGDVVALVGESGAGKSTLVDLISGYYFPTKGSIVIDGIDSREIDLKKLRDAIAVVPQDVSLLNDTVLNNIRYGRFGVKDSVIREATRLAHASEFIKAFPKKYKQRVGERGIKLSGGQKQRVAIARAILRDPKILILDEPTSALDAKSEKFIQDSLANLMKDRTTFIIAHRLSTVKRADKILVINNGKIVESGTHNQLVKKRGGEYRHLYELQIGLHE